MLRLFQRSDPGSPPASTARLYLASTGQGYNTPAAMQAIDSSGQIVGLGHFTALDYKLLKISTFTASATWTPTNGCRAYFIEAWGGGGQGGGAATSSATCSVGGGGGGGAYVGALITPSAATTLSIITTVAFTIGAAGSGAAGGATGTVGGDTLWPTSASYINAKGGSGGAALAAGSTFLAQVGGAGGVAASCVVGGANTPANTTISGLAISGGIGDKGVRLSATQAWSGNGGVAALLGTVGADGVVAVTGGTAGVAGAAGAYGCGGSGAATLTTSAAGGAGIGGLIRVWELA